jgi:hypothetical protein
MKYLKTYKLFEELELLDRGYSDNLQDEFKSDISDICLDLDDIYPLSISFDDSKYRSSNLFRHIGNDTGYQRGTTKERDDYWKSDYPSITISREGSYRGMDSKLQFKTGRGSGYFNNKLIENWNKECLSVAYRIKRYLGDNFLLFTIEDNGNVTATGNVTAYSDARVKTNISNIDSPLEKIMKMRGVYYNRIDDIESKRQVGVIAQEVEEVLPEVVLTDTSENKNKSVAYGNIVALLIEGMKAQQSTIEALLDKLPA